MSVTNKIIGIFMICLGIFMSVFFFNPKDYQPNKFSWLGVAFGIPCFYIGFYLLLH